MFFGGVDIARAKTELHFLDKIRGLNYWNKELGRKIEEHSAILGVFDNSFPTPQTIPQG